jgi:hypothetical protein
MRIRIHNTDYLNLCAGDERAEGRRVCAEADDDVRGAAHPGQDLQEHHRQRQQARPQLPEGLRVLLQVSPRTRACCGL